MDENNQYVNAMSKPLRHGCIKKQKMVTSLRKLDIILNALPYTNNIGHLFVVDINFYRKNEKTLFLNEIYTPILVWGVRGVTGSTF